MQERIISALVGLAGVINNGEKTDNTDNVLLKALSFAGRSESSEEEVMVVYKEIRREIFTISPSCETCQSPCGNTSDFDLSQLERNPEDIRALKEEMIKEAIDAASRLLKTGQTDGVDLLYKSMSYLKFMLTKESYQETIDRLRKL